VTFFMLATRMNNHAAVLPVVRAECNELTTSRRKEVVMPFIYPRHIPESSSFQTTIVTSSLQSAFKSSHPQFLVVPAASLQSDFYTHSHIP
jgi:hypothetical protein